MSAIRANTPAGQKKEANAEFVDARANAAIVDIDADIAILSGSPTNAQVLQILRRVLQRQKKIIRVLQHVAKD